MRRLAIRLLQTKLTMMVNGVLINQNLSPSHGIVTVLAGVAAVIAVAVAVAVAATRRKNSQKKIPIYNKHLWNKSLT